MLRHLTVTILLLFGTSVCAEIYSWRDADGRMHYGDNPPASAKASARVVQLPNDPQGVPNPLASPITIMPPATPDKGRTGNGAAAKNEERERQLACEEARKAMQDFQEEPRRTAVSGRGGKRSFNAVDGAERAEREEKLQKAIEEACGR